MKETAVITLILISLMTLSVACVRNVKSQYQSSITINADGSVSPSTAPIARVDNTYILTENVVGTIALQKDDTVFDGNCCTLSGTVQLHSVENVTLKNLTVKGSAFGIDMESASNVTVTNNTITETGKNVILPGPPVSMGNPTAGVFIYAGGSNIIAGNNLLNNLCGIILFETSHNLLVENNVTSNSLALDLYSSSDNRIYHNNFINNTGLVEDDSIGYSGPMSINIWDDGLRFGNYWSDYLTRYPYAKERDTSGIGATPYFVKPVGYVDPASVWRSEAKEYWTRFNALYAVNTDRYPLMQPFSNTFYAQATTPPKITLTSPLNQTYYRSNVSLAFAVDKPVKWIRYSLDGAANMTILENSTIANITTGFHNLTLYANDTYGNIGASQTVAFAVAAPASFPVVPVVAAASVAAVALVGVGLLVYFKKRKHQAKT